MREKFGLIMAFVLIASIGFVSAGPDDHTVYGLVTVGGEDAPAGTVVKAIDPDGVECGSRTVTNEGVYTAFNIKSDDPATPEDEGAVEGDTITFMIDGAEANEKLIFSKGATTRLDLSTDMQRFDVTVELDVYYREETVLITGYLLDVKGNSMASRQVSLQVNDPSDAVLLADQVQTNINGEFSYSFDLADDALIGVYTVIGSSNGVSDSDTFTVSDEIKPTCKEIWIYSSWSECLPGDVKIRAAYDINQCGTTEKQEELTQPCTFTYPAECNGTEVSIFTDKPGYEPGEVVSVYGYVLNGTCNGIEGYLLNLSALMNETELFSEEDVMTNSDGVYSYSYYTDGTEDTGVYDLLAKVGGNAVATGSFELLASCDADNDGYIASECGGNDFDDNDKNKYPGALCERPGFTGSTYNENGECTGGNDEQTSTSTGGGASSGGFGGGGGAVVSNECEPDWACTPWAPEECPESEVKTRQCTDLLNCGTDKGKPPETQDCVYTPPINTGGDVVCGDGVCSGSETCGTCSSDCGECPIAPSGNLCGNGICESTENCDSCSSDCGECPEPEQPPATVGGGLEGMIPGGTAGLGGIALLIVAIILVGYLFATRKKGYEDEE